MGDSITAGAGAAGSSEQTEQTLSNSDATLSYAFVAAQALNANFSIMALEDICIRDGDNTAYDKYLHYSFSNSNRYDPAKFDANVVVLGLGENDMRNVADGSSYYTARQFQQDYTELIQLVRQTRPNATIVCVYGMSPATSTPQAQELIENAIADTNDTNVYSLKLTSNEAGANKHPAAATHKINGNNLAKRIKELLN